VPIALLALALGWGVTGVWAGLVALMGVRLVTIGWRFAGGRWAVTGAAAAP
jgi:Na+-driven multidrug efflux pump